MASFDEIQEYCHTVCAQIRWKKARPLVEKELQDHLCDQAAAYRTAGMNEQSAIHSAVQQMGDAVSVGAALDKAHRPRPQWVLLVLTGSLLLVGQFFSAVFGGAAEPLGLLCAAAALLGCYYFDAFALMQRRPLPFYFGSLLICAFALLRTFSINGYAWGSLFGVSFPLSFLSLGFPLVFSMLIYALRGCGLFGVLLCGAGYLPLAFLLAHIPTISGLFLFTSAALALLCFALAKGWFGCNKAAGFALVLIPVAAGIGLLIWFIFNTPSVLARISILFDPAADKSGLGYLVYVVRNVLAAAKPYGTGSAVAGDPAALGFLDRASSDYLLTLLIYRFGWVALVLVVIAFAAFGILCCRAIAKQKSMLGSLVAISVLSVLLLQCLFYLASNLSYSLLEPFSLPFLSAGNAALVINAALTGLMLSVFRSGDGLCDHCPGKTSSSLFSYQNGSLTIHIKN